MSAVSAQRSCLATALAPPTRATAAPMLGTPVTTKAQLPPPALCEAPAVPLERMMSAEAPANGVAAATLLATGTPAATATTAAAASSGHECCAAVMLSFRRSHMRIVVEVGKLVELLLS